MSNGRRLLFAFLAVFAGTFILVGVVEYAAWSNVPWAGFEVATVSSQGSQYSLLPLRGRARCWIFKNWDTLSAPLATWDASCARRLLAAERGDGESAPWCCSGWVRGTVGLRSQRLVFVSRPVLNSLVWSLPTSVVLTILAIPLLLKRRADRRATSSAKGDPEGGANGLSSTSEKRCGSRRRRLLAHWELTALVLIAVSGTWSFVILWKTLGTWKEGLPYQRWRGYDNLAVFLVEDAVWRVGGPDPARIASLFQRLEGTGAYSVLDTVDSRVTASLRSGGRLSAASLPFPAVDPRDSSFARQLKNDLAREAQSRSARMAQLEAELRLCKASGSDSEPMSQRLAQRASSALAQGMDSLVPLIEAGIADGSIASSGGASAYELSYLYLPLARARTQPEPDQALVGLIRKGCASLAAREPTSDVTSRLVREALQDLVWRGARRAAPELKQIFESFRSSVRPPLGKPLLDGDPAAVAASCLLRAIRVMGDPGFGENVWSHWYPESVSGVEQTLCEEGMLQGGCCPK